MFINKKSLLFLIEAEVAKVLLREQEEGEEQDVADATPETPPVPDTPASPAPPGAQTPQTPVENEEDATGSEPQDSAPDALGSNISGGGSGGLRSTNAANLDIDDDGDLGIMPDQGDEEEESLSLTVGPEDVEIPADPVLAITDDAIQMLEKTQQPSVIFKLIKHEIQKYFPDPMDATPIIKNLWDTEDLVLRDVARRLLLFIKGI